jgi:hypothetical protein
MRALALALLAAGCLDAPTFDGTMYKCVEQQICPNGYTCSSGTCVIDPQTNAGFVRIAGATFTRGCMDSGE